MTFFFDDNTNVENSKSSFTHSSIVIKFCYNTFNNLPRQVCRSASEKSEHLFELSSANKKKGLKRVALKFQQIQYE